VGGVGRRDGGASGVHGDGPLLAGVSGHGTPEAHVEHVAHVCDAGRVEAERLVERRRALPRVKRTAYAVRGELCGPAGGRCWATAVQAARWEGLDCRSGAGHGEERT